MSDKFTARVHPDTTGSYGAEIRKDLAGSSWWEQLFYSNLWIAIVSKGFVDKEMVTAVKKVLSDVGGQVLLEDGRKSVG